MGLDMYLTKQIYVGAQHSFNGVKGVVSLTRGTDQKPIKVNTNKITKIVEDVASWRKANAIHGWFVENVQDGEDDCKEYEVTYEQLVTLKKLCEKVLETKDATLLPPVAGFFFGGIEADEYYYQYLQQTIDIINDLDPESDYIYQASW